MEKLIVKIKILFHKIYLKYLLYLKNNKILGNIINIPTIVSTMIVFLFGVILIASSPTDYIPAIILIIFCLELFSLVPVIVIRFLFLSLQDYILHIELYNVLHNTQKSFVLKTNKTIHREAVNYISNLLNEATRLAAIINTTKNEAEFYHCHNKLSSTLSRLCDFEKFNLFNDSSPSEDLNNLRLHKQDAIDALHVRMTGITSTSNISYDNMEGHDFEYFCADLLRKNGFVNVEVTQGSGDHGIDILANKDDISYAIQCKCYSSNIGNAAVQQAHTGKSLYHKDIAVVMTNRYFTQQAIEEANALGVKLWDRDKLNSMIKKSY